MTDQVVMAAGLIHGLLDRRREQDEHEAEAAGQEATSAIGALEAVVDDDGIVTGQIRATLYGAPVLITVTDR